MDSLARSESSNTGFPRVLNAIFVAKRVFEERDVDPVMAEASSAPRSH